MQNCADASIKDSLKHLSTTPLLQRTKQFPINLFHLEGDVHFDVPCEDKQPLRFYAQLVVMKLLRNIWSAARSDSNLTSARNVSAY